MERRNNSLIFIVLAAFAGMFAIAPRATESTPQPPAPARVAMPAASASPSPTPAGAAADLLPVEVMIDEFYRGDKDSQHHATGSPVQKIWPVDSIIAILPDPVESALGNQFDNFLDAIQRALADSGYALDRFRNPWPLPAGGGQSSADDQKNRFNNGDSDPTKKPTYTQEPGMMLFLDPTNGKLMVIFLVGETPTRGLHKSALKSALSQALKIARTYPATEPDAGVVGTSAKVVGPRIKVMGPSFTGSAVSMKFALRSWLSDRESAGVKGIDIVSGSATAINRKEFLEYFSDFNHMVEYNATVIPDDFVLKKLRDWLDRSEGDEIAILAEEDTVYASDVAGPEKSEKSERVEKLEQQYATPEQLAKLAKLHKSEKLEQLKKLEKRAGPSLAPDDHSLRLSFPMHIAELQRAMQRAQANLKTGAMPLPLLQNPNLPLGTEEAQTRVDVFPLFSNSETNSLELLLDGVMRTITDRRIRYVVIIATDIEDTIFLAQKIRESCPNVTPILLNGDVLFLHSSVNTFLRGTIVASTYPLYFENQFWTRPQAANHTALVQFPSDTAEGVYNATLALVGHTDMMLDYAEPFDPKSKRPPAWITMVGTDQFWPLAIFPVGPSFADLKKEADAKHLAVDTSIDTHTADYLVEPSGRRSQAKPGNPTFIVYPSPFLLLCAIVGIGSVAAWRLCTHTPTAQSRGFDYAIYRLRTVLPVFVQQSFAPAPDADSAQSRRAIVFMFLMALFGLSTTVACFFFLPLRTGPQVRSMVLRFDPLAKILWLLALLVAFAGLIGAIVRWSDRVVLDPSVRSELRRGRTWEAAAIAVVALVVVLWVGLAPTKSAQRIFFFFRIVDLDGGASPLVPLLLAYGACFVMVLGAMRRRTFVEARMLNARFLGFETDSFSGVAELEAQVRDAVHDDGWKSWQWWTAVGTVSTAYLIYSRPWESTIDGTIVMLAFFAFSLAAYLGIATALLRLLTVWGATRRLLQRMFWHPSRDGYSKLRELMSARDAAIDLFSPEPTVTALEAGLAEVRVMLKEARSASQHGDATVCDLLRKFCVALTEGLAASEASLNLTLQAGVRGDWDCEAKHRRETELKLDYVSKLVALIFEPLWRTRNSSTAESTRAEGDKSPPIDPAGDVYVATRVIDLLRQVMPQLRTFAVTSTFAMLMMLFAISSYPFPTRDHLLWFSWGMVLAAVASILWMYFSFNRDRVVSLICGTTPGHIDWNSTLLTQLLTHGLLPILVLLGAAYPAELGHLAQWAGGLFGGRG